MINVFLTREYDTLIGSVDTVREANILVSKYIEENWEPKGFHSYYTRMAFHDDQRTVWQDVGSHFQFFELRFDTVEEYMRAKGEVLNA